MHERRIALEYYGPTPYYEDDLKYFFAQHWRELSGGAFKTKEQLIELIIKVDSWDIFGANGSGDADFAADYLIEILHYGNFVSIVV